MLNYKQKSEVSSAIWVPLIWFAIAISRSLANWLSLGSQDIESSSYLSGNMVDRTFDSVLLVIGLIILLVRKIDWSQIRKDNIWIIILYLFMGISIFWSGFPEVSFKRYIRAICVLIMALVILTDGNPLEALSKLLKRCFYIHISLSFLFIMYFRNIGVGYDDFGKEYWNGVAAGKNGLGQLAMISGIYFVWDILRNWSNKKIIINFIFLLASLWLLIGANSVTSIVVFFSGIIILLILHPAKIKTERTDKSIKLCVYFIIISILSYQFLLPIIIEAFGRDPTLTGRTTLWGDVLRIVYRRSPILGVGYGGFWIGNLGNDLWNWAAYVWKPQQSHNGYIDVYVELGLGGIFLIVCLIFSIIKNIKKTFEINYEYGRFRMILLTMILLHNITESSLIKGYHSFWFLFLVIAMNVSKTMKLDTFKK